MNAKYEAIIDLPHHVSVKRQPMTMVNRGAQFAPFAALRGYDDIVQETARVTHHKPILSEEESHDLNEALKQLQEHKGQSVTITYFLPDAHKEGGEIFTRDVSVHKVDAYTQELVLSDGTKMAFENLLAIKEKAE